MRGAARGARELLLLRLLSGGRGLPLVRTRSLPYTPPGGLLIVIARECYYCGSVGPKMCPARALFEESGWEKASPY